MRNVCTSALAGHNANPALCPATPNFKIWRWGLLCIYLIASCNTFQIAAFGLSTRPAHVRPASQRVKHTGSEGNEITHEREPGGLETRVICYTDLQWSNVVGLWAFGAVFYAETDLLAFFQSAEPFAVDR